MLAELREDNEKLHQVMLEKENDFAKVKQELHAQQVAREEEWQALLLEKQEEMKKIQEEFAGSHKEKDTLIGNMKEQIDSLNRKLSEQSGGCSIL